jgi:hypothetical protein
MSIDTIGSDVEVPSLDHACADLPPVRNPILESAYDRFFSPWDKLIAQQNEPGN